MQVVLVGSGQLARELREGLRLAPGLERVDWESPARAESASLVVHAGSGRQLPQVMEFCDRTQSTLLELATRSELSERQVGFPVVLCPNTNLLMLKFMRMVAAGAIRGSMARAGVARAPASRVRSGLRDSGMERAARDLPVRTGRSVRRAGSPP